MKFRLFFDSLNTYTICDSLVDVVGSTSILTTILSWSSLDALSPIEGILGKDFWILRLTLLSDLFLLLDSIIFLKFHGQLFSYITTTVKNVYFI